MTEAAPAISLLHATWGRPKLCIESRKTWLGLAKNPETVEHLFAIDDGDEASFRATEGLNRTIVKNPVGSGKAFNQAAHESKGDVLILMSDDVIPPKHWDELILGRVGADRQKPCVLAVWEGVRADALMCYPVFTRAYLRLYPEFLGPYRGIYGDTEFTWRAYKSGFVREAREILFFHDHPFLTGKEMDETYRRQNNALEYARGAVLFLKRNPDATIVRSGGDFWLCYQLPDGEYVGIQSLPPEAIARRAGELPEISYLNDQCRKNLEARINRILTPEISDQFSDYVKSKFTEAIIRCYEKK